MDFVAYDLETTGIDAETEAIVEIGAVRFMDGRPQSGFGTLIDPHRPIPEGASAVNGITDDMVQGKPTIEAVLGRFTNYCGDLPLVAHNAKFDFKFLLRAYQTHKTPAPTGVNLDSFTLAKTVLRGLPNYRLETLIRYYKIPATTFHRAEQDAAYCGKVFQRILDALKVGGHPIHPNALSDLTGKKPLQFPIIERETTEQLALF